MAVAVPMPLDLISPNRRLWFAIGISILLHGILLTLNFQFPDASRMRNVRLPAMVSLSLMLTSTTSLTGTWKPSPLEPWKRMMPLLI